MNASYSFAQAKSFVIDDLAQQEKPKAVEEFLKTHQVPLKTQNKPPPPPTPQI
jgi:hypothetical protein